MLFHNINVYLYLESCILSNDIYDYHIVAQGKTTIPNVDDGEECLLTDVSSIPLRTEDTPTSFQVFDD